MVGENDGNFPNEGNLRIENCSESIVKHVFIAWYQMNMESKSQWIFSNNNGIPLKLIAKKEYQLFTKEFQ